jgi:hypothetical protein
MNQQTSQAATSAAGIGQNLAEWEPHLTNSGQLIRNSNQQLQQLQLTVAEVARDILQTKTLTGDVHIGQKLLQIKNLTTKSNHLGRGNSQKLLHLLRTTHEEFCDTQSGLHSALTPSSPRFFLNRVHTLLNSNDDTDEPVDEARSKLLRVPSPSTSGSRTVSPFELQPSFLPETYLCNR